jgi:hypothetical protein
MKMFLRFFSLLLQTIALYAVLSSKDYHLGYALLSLAFSLWVIGGLFKTKTA